MKLRGSLIFLYLLCFATAVTAARAQAAVPQAAVKAEQRHSPRAYFGFDKNDYPGDDLLPALRKSFAFTGYWLNNPPGMTSNPWTGKRRVVRAAGFGFAVLFNGRLDAELKTQDAAALGRSDAATAVAAAIREDFPARTILFLDQEEGGHLAPEQAAYLYAWIDAVERSTMRPGVYCSGIAVGTSDLGTTALDILRHYASARSAAPALWVANDQCPPAPGCILLPMASTPAESGVSQAAIWQYAQSPRRPEFTAACAAAYPADNFCYAPVSAPGSPKITVDLNAAISPDPSHGR